MRFHKSQITTKWKLSFFLCLIIFTLAGAIENKSSNSQSSTTSFNHISSSLLTPSPSSQNEEIYIDDESVGSGHGGITDDLEKSSDYSGSGFGPDDEDATHHINNKNNKNKATENISTGKYNINISGSNKNNGNNNGMKGSKPISTTTTHKITTTSNSDISVDVDTEPDDSEKDEYDGSGDYDDHTDTDHDATSESENKVATSSKGIELTNTNEVAPGGEDIGRTTINTSGTSINPGLNEVLIMNEERTTSFFAQPGILAAVIGGAVVGLLCAILVVMFIVYRMRKKDEGSYALDEPKRSPAVNSYAKNGNNREFYA